MEITMKLKLKINYANVINTGFKNYMSDKNYKSQQTYEIKNKNQHELSVSTSIFLKKLSIEILGVRGPWLQFKTRVK